ncbi:MAG: LysR family transcriptional regulator [Pseudomonadota bacterium]
MKNIRNTDLNLLVAFDALMAERSVTKAGERIGLTQPSMSNALARLRSLFDDELFVRSPEGMTPTAVAMEAAAHIKASIYAAEEALNVNVGAFKPEDAEGAITLLTNDLIEFTILPNIIRAMGQQAPKLRLRTRPLIKEAFEQELDTGLSDFAIAAPVEVPKRFGYNDLFDEPFDGIARIGHPILSGTITVEEFFAYKHVAVSHRFGATGLIEKAVSNFDRTLDIAVSVSNIASVPPLVSMTDFISVVPRRLATIGAREELIAKFDLPFEIPSVSAKLIWGRGADRSPMSSWFRNLVVDITIRNKTGAFAHGE